MNICEVRGWAVLLALAVVPPAFARGETPVSAQSEVARLEESYSQSFVTGDVSVAQRLVADDFVGLEPDGKTSDKRQILKDVIGEPRPRSLTIPAIIVRIHGDTALALGTEVDVMPAKAPPVRRRWLDTWRRTPDGWRLVASAEMVSPP